MTTSILRQMDPDIAARDMFEELGLALPSPLVRMDKQKVIALGNEQIIERGQSPISVLQSSGSFGLVLEEIKVRGPASNAGRGIASGFGTALGAGGSTAQFGAGVAAGTGTVAGVGGAIKAAAGSAAGVGGTAGTDVDEYPDATNTGIEDGVTLTPLSGDQTINSSGTYENKDITGGSLVVNANNVTVKNCRVTFDEGSAKILVNTGMTGIIIEHCEVDGTSGNQGAKGIWVDEAEDVEIRYCNIHHVEDCIYAFGNGTYIHDNYLHTPANINEDPHHDLIQFAGTGVRIHHNTMQCGTNQNACIQFAGTPGYSIDVEIVNNKMLALEGVAPLSLMNMNDSLVETTVVVVKDNLFSPGTHAANPYFAFNVQVPNVWLNNRDSDTGDQIGPPNVTVAGDEGEGVVQIGVSASANTGTLTTTLNVPVDTEMALVFLSGYGRADTANYHSNGTVTMTKSGSDTAMTAIGAADGNTGLFQGALWYIMAPDTGANKTIKWDWAGSSISDDQIKNFVVVFLKGVDTGDPIEASGGAQAGSAPVSTGSLAGGFNKRAFIFAAMYNGSGDGTGSIDSWTNCVELMEVAHHSTSEIAIATASPASSTAYSAATSSNVTNVAISAVVINAAGYL